MNSARECAATSSGLNYVSGYRDVDGIIVPAKRRVYPYEGD